MSAIMRWFEHSLTLPFFGTGMKTDLFQSCGHCWVFQIYWHIEYSTFTASSFFSASKKNETMLFSATWLDLRYCHTEWSKSDRKGKISCGILICRIRKEMIQVNLLTKQKETHREWTYSCLYIWLYSKWITYKDLLCSTWNSAQYYMAAWMGGEIRGWWIVYIYIYIYIWMSPFSVYLKLSQHC